MAAICALVDSARLVTVIGPPGIGKTRTALRVAIDVDRPAWFCDLSSAHSTADMCSEVARALGITLVDDAVISLGGRLARMKPSLLVLDNFEQLVEPGAAVVSRWLELAPQATILVTSRERLRLREERVVELPPLSEDDAALKLFEDRARAHRPDFAVKPEQRSTLRAVVAALEGNPLAIELAAARVDVLGLEGLRERLNARLELLSRGARGNDRQASLSAAIDASWQLLDADQQRALSRLAIFRGGFSLAAAEAVVGSDALDRIQDLRDRSLVRPPRDGRFALYESIRAFALDALNADRPEAERAHSTFFLELGQTQARRFHRDGGSVDAIALERDNLLAVFERAMDAGEHHHAMRAALNLMPLLSTRGPARFHLGLLERASAVLPDEPALLHSRGLAKRAVGDLDGAERDLLAGLEASPDGWLYACMQKDLGVLYHQRRRIDQARARYESALLAARADDDRRLEGIVTGNLGALDHDIGRFEEATRLYTAALDRLREVGDTRLEGIFWTNVGVLEQEQGGAKTARKHYERALSLLEGSGDSRFEAIALGNLGVLEHEAGDRSAALERHEQALELLEEVGDARSEALCRARLGAVIAELGDAEAAEAQLDEAERLVVGRDALGLELVRLHRCFLELAAGDETAAFARIERAQAPREGEPSLAEVNDDARMLLRMLASVMKRGRGPRLEVGPEAAWFRPPGGAVQSLQKYAAARNILERLTVARLGDRAPLSSEALFTAGWPGVKIAPQSANNRLYVALAKLRKMGLKVLLLRTDEGYLLDPNTPVLRVDSM